MESKQEANITQVEDNEPAFLLEKHDNEEECVMLLNEEKVMPKLSKDGDKTRRDSNIW